MNRLNEANLKTTSLAQNFEQQDDLGDVITAGLRPSGSWNQVKSPATLLAATILIQQIRRV